MAWQCVKISFADVSILPNCTNLKIVLVFLYQIKSQLQILRVRGQGGGCGRISQVASLSGQIRSRSFSRKGNPTDPRLARVVGGPERDPVHGVPGEPFSKKKKKLKNFSNEESNTVESA
jgi:hypothetical protein